MSKASILIVEDEAIIAADLANKLRDRDYEVVGITARGEEAVALAQSRRPDLVLMDIQLAGAMDGVAAAEVIRQQCDLPVVYLTAHSDRTTLQRAKLTQPFGYILKPFEERELEAHIEMALYKHQTDRKLREQREWLRITLTSIGDAVIATDTAGRITFLNPVAESVTGWKERDALGRPIASVFRIINEQTRQTAEDIVERVLREGHVVNLANHTALITRDGGEILIEDSAAPIRDGVGRVAGVVLVFHDVTEKRRAQEVQRRYQLIVAHSRDLILFMRRDDGQILEANAAAASAYGYTKEEMLAFTIQDLRAPETRALTAEQMAQADDQGILFETVHRRKDGSTFPVEVSSQGAVVGGTRTLVSVIRDITDRKQAEEALRQAKDELEGRVRERTAALSEAIGILEGQAAQLRALAAELTSVEQRERRRLAEVLHDGLQQLLVAARVRAHMLGRSSDPGVRDGCQEMVALLEEALTEARTLTGELSPPTLQKGGLLPALEWLTGWMGAKHHLTVRVRPPAAPLPALAEDVSVLLYQAVRELLLNTVKYAQVTVAEVALTQEDDTLALTVADAGVGFDPTRLRVFGGTEGGFGLFGIRERLELMGGRLTVESRPGRGSRFTLVAPLRPASGEESAIRPREVPAVAPGGVPAGRRTRVLVVDDHGLVRRGFATLLAGEPDLEVVGEAADGKVAIELTRQLRPDVILMDVNMPVLDGIEATRAIHVEFPAVRVIGLSVLDATDQPAAMGEAGAVAYLSKSDSAEALLAAVRGGGASPT